MGVSRLPSALTHHERFRCVARAPQETRHNEPDTAVVMNTDLRHTTKHTPTVETGRTKGRPPREPSCRSGVSRSKKHPSSGRSASMANATSGRHWLTFATTDTRCHITFTLGDRQPGTPSKPRHRPALTQCAAPTSAMRTSVILVASASSRHRRAWVALTGHSQATARLPPLAASQ